MLQVGRCAPAPGIQPCTNFPWCEPFQRPLTDRPSDQPQRRIADRRGHASDLSVATFADRQLDPARRNRLAKADRRIARPQPCRLVHATRGRGQGLAVIQHHASPQTRQRSFVRLALDLHEVGLLGFPARVGEPRLQRAVARQQYQAFTVVVETPGGTHARRVDEVAQRRLAVRTRELREHLERLVEQQHDGHQRGSLSASMCSAVLCTRSMKRCTEAAFSPRRHARISGAVRWALSASLR